VVELAVVIILLIASTFLTLALTKYFGNLFKRLGYVGIDVFKVRRVEVPLLAGLSIPISLIIFLYVGYIINIIHYRIFISLSLVILSILLVGLLDDFFDMPGIYKPVACMLGGIPIILFGTYDIHLSFPFGVGFRISIIYLLLIIVGISVSANTVNMLDVANGVVSLASMIVFITMGLSVYIVHGYTNLYPILLGIFVILGFFYYNKYPARVFLGNAPALVIGAYIASLAIIYQVEFPTVVSMYPFIHNSFFFLSKVRRFVEHKKLNIVITKLDDDGYIHDACYEGAPITLLRFLVSREPLRENDVVWSITILFIFSSILAIVSAFLMGWGL
jgi:UDP-N-acetylglucosamine--dolichyl-phosphate N-acetylglucosaminephosphotransferase